MKTIRDYIDFCLNEWFYQSPKGYLVFITEIDRVAENMAYLAMEMCERGEY